MLNSGLRDERCIYPKLTELLTDYAEKKLDLEETTKRFGVMGEEIDLFSVGTILYQCITSNLPELDITDKIRALNLASNRPSNNIYNNLGEFEKRIISDPFSYIIMRSLSLEEDIKFKTLREFKEALERQKEQLKNMEETIWEILGHPIIYEGESKCRRNEGREINCTDCHFTEFELKYLGKFIYSNRISTLKLNGSYLPLGALYANSLTFLSLRNTNLYAEDIYILAKFIYHNHTLRELNISKNKIGYRQERRQMESTTLLGVTDRQIITEESTLGVEHLALALERNTNLAALDLSENYISCSNAKYLYSVLRANTALLKLSFSTTGVLCIYIYIYIL